MYKRCTSTMVYYMQKKGFVYRENIVLSSSLPNLCCISNIVLDPAVQRTQSSSRSVLAQSSLCLSSSGYCCWRRSHSNMCLTGTCNTCHLDWLARKELTQARRARHQIEARKKERELAAAARRRRTQERKEEEHGQEGTHTDSASATTTTTTTTTSAQSNA